MNKNKPLIVNHFDSQSRSGFAVALRDRLSGAATTFDYTPPRVELAETVRLEIQSLRELLVQ